MTPDQRREHAAELMLGHAREVERLSIHEHLDDGEVEYGTDDVSAIQKLIRTATVSVEWPEIAFESAGGDR